MSIVTDFSRDTVAYYEGARQTDGSFLYDPTAVSASLGCNIQFKKQDSQSWVAPRPDETTLSELHELFCAFGTALHKDGVIKILTSGHPQINLYFYIRGEPIHRKSALDANLAYCKALIELGPTPPWSTPPA